MYASSVLQRDYVNGQCIPVIDKYTVHEGNINETMFRFRFLHTSFCGSCWIVSKIDGEIERKRLIQSESVLKIHIKIKIFRIFK